MAREFSAQCDALVNSGKIFITAFEPYDDWMENSSWLALIEFTKTMRDDAQIMTRRYPVDFDRVRRLDQRINNEIIEACRDNNEFGIPRNQVALDNFDFVHTDPSALDVS